MLITTACTIPTHLLDNNISAHTFILKAEIITPTSCTLCSGELFGVCPIPRGQLHIAVESATDSSRNFVLRLEDPATKRHAFIGMSFGDRSAAFDFNVALVGHLNKVVLRFFCPGSWQDRIKHLDLHFLVTIEYW